MSLKDNSDLANLKETIKNAFAEASPAPVEEEPVVDRIVADCCPKCKGVDLVVDAIETYFVPNSKWARRNGRQVLCKACEFRGPVKADAYDAIEYWNAIITILTDGGKDDYVWFNLVGDNPEAKSVYGHLASRPNRFQAQKDFQHLLWDLRPKAPREDIVVEVAYGSEKDPNLVLTVQNYEGGVPRGDTYEVIIAKFYVASMALIKDGAKGIEGFLNDTLAEAA